MPENCLRLSPSGSRRRYFRLVSGSLSVIGVIGIALHKVVIGWIARCYEQKRYTCFERYRQ